MLDQWQVAQQVLSCSEGNGSGEAKEPDRNIMEDRRGLLDASKTQRHWWVNHTGRVDEGYIWAPKRHHLGRRLRHWTNVRCVSQGDVLLLYAKGAIRALGQAAEDAREAERPYGHAPQGRDGYCARLRRWNLRDPIQLREIPSELRPGRKGGPFNRAHGVNRGFVFPLGSDLADQIRRHFLDRWPSKSPWGGVTGTSSEQARLAPL